MPLIEDTPSTPPVEAPLAPKIAKPQYRGVTVDTRYIPNTALATYVEGSSWTVNYYSQVVDQDSSLSGQNVGQLAPYQQYRLINGMELKVTAPLTSVQDPQTRVIITTGAANVYPFLIPNEGDMFLADMGDGREGVFEITSTERRSIFKEAVFAIEYQFIDYSTIERRSDLTIKTIQRLQFVRDFMNYGQNPLLEEEDFTILRDLKARYTEITSRYFKSFMSNEFKTLMIPGQEFYAYDHFLVTAVMANFTTYDSPEIRYVRKLNADGDDNMNCTTIWNALRERDIKLLKHCIFESGLVSARTFERNPMFEGIYHSGINYVVYPKDPELSVDYQTKYREKPLSDVVLIDSLPHLYTLADLLGDTEFEGLTIPGSPPIHPVLIDDYYIFSEAFYTNAETGQSLIEICVRDYLNKRAINNRILLALCNTMHAWGGLERFYYTPILLILIKASIRAI